MTVMTENARGEWVPAIPLPFFGLRKKCRCGAKFWTTEGYRAHYALRHVLDPGPEVIFRTRGPNNTAPPTQEDE